MATGMRIQVRREDLKPGEVLCDYCTAKCCRYFALPIDTPESQQEWDYLRWYLLHDRACVFKDSGSYYLEVQTVCKHLRDDQRCGIYETRPQICRDYTTDDCEYEDHWVYEQYFETAEQVHEYTEAILPPAGSIRSPRPVLLPILA